MSFFTEGSFLRSFAVRVEKPFDYLVLDRDKNEYYRKFNKSKL